MLRVGRLNLCAPPSTIEAACSCTVRPKHHSQRCGATRAAADQFCKDKVNLSRHDTGESSAEIVTVSFLGAGGQKLSVPCPKDTYILDAGLDNGIELPYTCRGGICGACVGRVASGQVDQSDVADLSFTLSNEEVDQGMALLCMSRPQTDVEIETQSDWGYSLGVGEWKGPSGQISGKTVDPLTPWERSQNAASS